MPMWILLSAGIFLLVSYEQEVTLFPSLALNMVLNFFLILGWHVPVAIYAFERRAEELGEVFA